MNQKNISAREKIESLINAKMLDAAIEASELEIHNNPTSPEGHVGYITATLLNQSSNKAILAIDKFKFSHDYERRLLGVTQFFIGQHYYCEGKIILHKVLSCQPEKLQNLPNWLQLANQCGLHKIIHDILVKLAKDQSLTPELKTAYATSALLFGDTTLAKKIYGELIETFPFTQKFHYEYAKLSKAEDKKHIDTMHTLLKRYPQGDGRSVWLHYAIGKEYEDLQQFDLAFAHFSKGGAAAKAAGNYHINFDLDVLDEVAKKLTLPKRNAKQAINCIPIFILGLPRTGSTLIERILSNHPKIETIGETFLFQVTLQKLSALPLSPIPSKTMITSIDDTDPEKIRSEYIRITQHLRTGKPYFIEKLPENFLYIKKIIQAFPEAKIIYSNREVNDVCVGLFKQPYFRFSYTTDDLGQYMRKHYELKNLYFNKFKGKIIEVDYENLVRNIALTMSDVFTKLGIAQNDCSLDPSANKAPSTTASAHQVREKIHQTSIGVYSHYNNDMATLFESLKDIT